MADLEQDPITPRQARFLACLLTEPTIGEAAVKAECGERTAYRWLAVPAFQAAYREARLAAVALATTQLQQATQQAVATLR